MGSCQHQEAGWAYVLLSPVEVRPLWLLIPASALWERGTSAFTSFIGWMDPPKLLALFMFILWLLHIDSVVWFFYDYNLLCCGVWRTAQQGSLTSSHPTRKAKCQRNSYYRMEFTKYVGRLFIFSPSLERQTLPLSRLSLGFCHVIPEISTQRQCQLVVNVTMNKNNFRTYTQSHTKQ